MEDYEENDKNKRDQTESFINIALEVPTMHLTTSSINSLFLFFSDDPDFQNKKSMNTSRKTLLKCLLKYGDIDRLLDHKKKKKRSKSIILLF